jgi:Peptidase C13 family
MTAQLRALYRNLVAGARLALFLPVRAFDFRATPFDYILLIAFNFVVWLVAAALRTGMEGEFDAAAPAIYLASVPVALVTALVVAHIYRAPERLLLIATALSAAESLFELLALALPWVVALTGYPRVALYIFLGWMWAAAVRAVVVCAGARRPQVLLGALAVTAMIGIGFYAFPRTDVWLAPEEDEEPAPLAGERLFHLQGELIERALAAIQPGRPGVRELYFVGFAPDASQDVFVNEMRYVRRLFDERFASAGHSIALVNSEDALEEFPIASVTNLERALTRVAAQMNGDEDTLFLYLSAHGYPDHRLSAVQPPLELASLTPTALARLLEATGIKWRVIVVSACYSGGFIEPLRDENSIIITASSAERTSFGCETGRDFTYFGEAYFRDALARTRSFTEAFARAKDEVAKREREEGLEASQPQMWVGRAIGARLQQPADRPDK